MTQLQVGLSVGCSGLGHSHVTAGSKSTEQCRFGISVCVLLRAAACQNVLKLFGRAEGDHHNQPAWRSAFYGSAYGRHVMVVS